MFWLKNKKIIFLVRTLNLSPVNLSPKLQRLAIMWAVMQKNTVFGVSDQVSNFV